MNGIIKDAVELSRREAERVFAIHARVYHPKRIGLPFGEWWANLTRSYHGVTSKRVHLWIDEATGTTVGYVIFTAPVYQSGKSWCKITEGGVDSPNPRDAVSIFLSMLRGLLGHPSFRETSFIAETGVSYPQIANLLGQCGFAFLNDPDHGEALLSRFLNSGRFSLSSAARGLVVRRRTIYSQNYDGFVQVLDRHKAEPRRPAFSEMLGISAGNA